MPLVVQNRFARNTLPELASSWEASKTPLPHASFLTSRLFDEDSRRKPKAPLSSARLPRRMFLDEEDR